MNSLTHVRSVWGVVLVASSLAVAGCAADATEDLDPAGTLEGMEFSDEGPPAGEPAPVEDTSPTSGLTVDEITNMPRFELPFPCGQVWAGQTRSNHSPTLAVDFNRVNDFGDPVVAAASGTVSRVDNEGSVSYGRWIEIDHGNGYRTRYAHLSSQLVRQGQHVDRGDRIGLLGSTGGSTGPHLHYELRRNGVVIRPVFHGATAFFWGTRNYTSQNCSSGGGGTSGGTTGVVGRVNTAGPALTVRRGPGTGYAGVGSVADGATVRITCQARGTSVSGTYGTSTLWDYIGNGYVADAYVSTGSDGQVAPTCR